MSQQTQRHWLNRSTLSVCALAITATMMFTTPLRAQADENMMNGDKSMPSEKMDHSKMDGMKPMEGMSMTGDTDYDFAANMRMHHQMAVDMSQAELKNGKNPQMRKMARNIITAQKKEIAKLDQWMKAHKKP